MAKYYIQSGTLRATLAADDARRAALWAVHQVMQQVLPVEEDADLTPEQRQDNKIVEGILVLDGTIRLSEQGYDREDAEEIATIDVVSEWNQLMVALDRLERLLEN